MKLSRVLVLGVAVVAGLIAAVLALNLTRPPATTVVDTTQRPEVATVPVLVAAKDLPTGATLSAGSVVWRDWPRGSVSSKFITRDSGGDPMTAVDGAIVRATIYDGEPINDAKLIHSDRGFMSAILPEGKRAVAIKIAADTSAGGFILPNDHVDVIMTRRVNQNGSVSGDNDYITETVLNNVRVLAIDQTIEKTGSGEGSDTVIGQTATLELTPEQAQIITVAQQMSDRLALALRSITDSTHTAADTAADATHLIGGTKASGAITMVKGGVSSQVMGIR
jgi:pilus assembly protein CpaB